MKIEYEPETRRKTFVAKINKPNLRNIENLETEEEKKALIRGIFLGSGSINDPTKKYHLEILLNDKDVLNNEILKFSKDIEIILDKEVEDFLVDEIKKCYKIKIKSIGRNISEKIYKV